MKSLRKAFSYADKLLLVLGMAGFVIFVTLLPRIHPDAVPDYVLDKAEIIDRAQSFLQNQGYSPADYNWTALPARYSRILDSLQVGENQRSLRQMLQEPAYDQLPLYAWDVLGERSARDEREEALITLKLTRQGEIWNFEARTPDIPGPQREALLATAFHRSRDEADLDSTSTDDLVARFWAIEGGSPDDSDPPPQGAQPPPIRPQSNRSRIPVFNRSDAESMARFYLEDTFFAGYTLRRDSVTRTEQLDRAYVSVSFSGTAPESNLPVVTTLHVSTAGVLQAIATEYDPVPEVQESPNGMNISLGTGNITGGIQFIGYIAIILFTIVLFLRRLNARLIDVKGAMQDAVWGGLFAAMTFGNEVGWQVFQETESVWVGLLLALALVVLAGSAGAFLIFIVSCATDSIARSIWPRRLETLTLARNARFVNIPMGRSLVRSVGLAGVFLGFTTLFLLIPGLQWTGLGNALPGTRSWSPVLALIASNGIYAMLICMVVLLSIGSTLYSKLPRYWLVISVIAFFAAILNMGPVEISPFWMQWLFSAIIGFTLMFMLLKFDYFSCFGGFMFFGILWQAAPMWLISIPDYALDTGLLLGLIPGVFLVGIIGLVSGREINDEAQFTPAYLREVAQQERMRSELEIARHVQASLLPRRMPSIRGMDVAAMCLPAQEVGGDYFDFIQLDKHRTALVIGDVSGKGIQAGFFMTLTKGFLHAVCETTTSPAEVLTHVNHLFCKNVPRGTFISLIFGVLDTASRTFTFARAGHDPMLFSSSSLEGPAFFKPGGMAIGLTPTRTFEEAIQNEVIHLSPNDLLVFYTDGVTEAVNPRHEQFGAERLQKKVDMIGLKKSARQVLQEVSEHIQAFVQSAGRADDMTMVVVRMGSPENAHLSKQEPESHSWLEHDLTS